MASTSEKEVEKSILEFLEWYPGYYWKNNSVGVYDARKQVYRKAKSKYIINGVSDILGVVNGKFVAIEVKSAKGRLSESQKDFMHQVKDKGGIAFVARCIEDVKRNLQDEFTTARQRDVQNSLSKAADVSEM